LKSQFFIKSYLTHTEGVWLFIEKYLLSSHPFRVESSPKSRLRSDVSSVERNICTMLHLVGMLQNMPIAWSHPYGMQFCGFTSFSTELHIPSACVR